MVQNFIITSAIFNHYARTTLHSKIFNIAPLSQEISYKFLIPETAIITNITMTSDNMDYTAAIMDRNSAQILYNEATGRNDSALILKMSSEHKDEVKLTVNIQGLQSVRFNLTYEEYLPQRKDAFRQTIRILSDGVFNVTGIVVVDVTRNGAQKINKLYMVDENLQEDATLGLESTAKIGSKRCRGELQFKSRPKSEFHKIAIDSLGRAYQQFSFAYTLQNAAEAETVLSPNNFLHFYSTDSLITYPKHIVFVIDVSGSMSGLKLDQTKEAMITLIDSLNEKDFFSIVTFNTNVYKWPDQRSLTHSATEEFKRKAVK